MSRNRFNSFSFIAPYVPLTDENRFIDTSAWWIPVQTDLKRHNLQPFTRIPVFLHSDPSEKYPMITLPPAIAHALRVPCMVRAPRSRIRPVINLAIWHSALHHVRTTDLSISKGA